MMGIIGLPRKVRLLPVATRVQEGFDPGDGYLFDEKIEVSHRPQIGGRVVLLSDGNTLQERDRRGTAFARIKDVTRRIESLSAQELGCQLGSVQQWS